MAAYGRKGQVQSFGGSGPRSEQKSHKAHKDAGHLLYKAVGIYTGGYGKADGAKEKHGAFGYDRKKLLKKRVTAKYSHWVAIRRPKERGMFILRSDSNRRHICPHITSWKRVRTTSKARRKEHIHPFPPTAARAENEKTVPAISTVSFS